MTEITDQQDKDTCRHIFSDGYCIDCTERELHWLRRNVAAMIEALKDTNAEIIRYGVAPDDYDWRDMLKRTLANARFWYE